MIRQGAIVFEMNKNTTGGGVNYTFLQYGYILLYFVNASKIRTT